MAAPSARQRLRPGGGTPLQRLRLATGLVLFAFVLGHFGNHALGIVSVDLMERVGEVRRALWQSPPGTFVLYGALLLHSALALWKTMSRRTLRMPVGEALQLALGLAIPILLIDHIIGTRGIGTVFGIDDSYPAVLTLLWPGLALSQTILVAVVWTHAVLGLHFWLRPKASYYRIAPALLVAAVVVPLLASLGWMEGARRLALTGESVLALTPEAVAWAGPVIETSKRVIIALVAIAVAVGLAGAFGLFSRSRLSIAYPGDRVVRARPGQTLLEISRENGIAHTAICGGRARCSTCRTRILSGLETLSKPREAERAVLARIDAPPDVRLACQIRPRANLTVQPLLPARPGALIGADSYRWGVEQTIAVLFVDIRGFTALSERRLPFDVVFILNEYLSAMSALVRKNGGVIDKYIGDAVMALYGIAASPQTAARQAILTAADMIDAVETLNAKLSGQLEEPLRIGIGIHAGPAILGRFGGREDQGLTALGDTVNTASRLEDATKELRSVLVVSHKVTELAGADPSSWRTERIAVRGRVDEITIHAVSEADAIRAAMGPGRPAELPVAAKALQAAD